MNLENLNAFLKLGYFLDYNSEGIKFNFKKKINLSQFNESELVKQGGELLQKAFDNNFSNNEKHLVPISGGLDSRAILAGLLEQTEAKNIYTFTFGQPGSYDYEIGNKLAVKLGTKHQVFNLKENIWQLDELIKTAKRFSFQTLLFYHPNTSKILSDYHGINYWSGYMGDPIAGSHLDSNEGQTKEAVKQKFIQKNTFVKSTNLCSGQATDLYPIIDLNKDYEALMTLTENIDFTNRQSKYIEPHVLFDGLVSKTPFLDQNWCEFMLSVNKRHRKETSLYKEILIKTYPKLFTYGVKDNLGLNLNCNSYHLKFKRLNHKVRNKLTQYNIPYQNPFTNYLDFNHEIRHNKVLNSIVKDQIHDLDKRQIIDWIDIKDVWHKFNKQGAKHADALITLASLEINLKAGKVL